MGTGQEQQWVRRSQGTAEIFCEGDGNWLVRSAMNRDRVIRLTAAELEDIVMMVIKPSTNVVAPDVVTR